MSAARLATAVLALAMIGAAPAPNPDAADQAVQKIVASPQFKAAVATLDREHDRTVADIITLTEIQAAPFHEAPKGKAYMAMLKAEGLSDVEMDPEGNVMGLRRGTGPAGGPVVVLAAHQDTVFPEGTKVTVKREGTRLSAPGIGDDTRSLAVVLAYIRALDAAKIQTKSDILFVGDVGEEGPGDLRGMRYLFGKGKYKDRIKAFFSMDGISAAGVTYGAVGSRRYRVAFHGPGGHSFGAQKLSHLARFVAACLRSGALPFGALRGADWAGAASDWAAAASAAGAMATGEAGAGGGAAAHARKCAHLRLLLKAVLLPPRTPTEVHALFLKASGRPLLQPLRAAMLEFMRLRILEREGGDEPGVLDAVAAAEAGLNGEALPVRIGKGASALRA